MLTNAQAISWVMFLRGQLLVVPSIRSDQMSTENQDTCLVLSCVLSLKGFSLYCASHMQ